MDVIQVVEKEIVRVERVKSFTMTVTTIDLFKSVSVSVTLYDRDERPIDNKFFVIAGDDYQQWTQDDKTLVQIIARKLGLTLE